MLIAATMPVVSDMSDASVAHALPLAVSAQATSARVRVLALACVCRA
jgi:hypothetical protein